VSRLTRATTPPPCGSPKSDEIKSRIEAATGKEVAEVQYEVAKTSRSPTGLF